MQEHQFASLYQINTRIRLGELSQQLRRHATFDDVPDSQLDRLAASGFDWLWFLGVWQTGPAGQKVARQHPGLRKAFEDALPDFHIEDVASSCFAVTGYTVHSDFGGPAALDRLRERIHKRGMRLLLDFVPNHTALDHPWVQEHPEFYVPGTEEQFQREPQNFIRMTDGGKTRVFAYGRDPYFAGWSDTLQLNYSVPAVQQAMRLELQKVAAQCDGVRCDMAMLILPDVFQRTWGLAAAPFWPQAINTVRSTQPDFTFMAEVYWGLEWTLQQQGFDYTYDKRLYDRLREGYARPVRDHFRADQDFQRRSARFLENHDEPRAAATFPADQHEAAAVLTYLCPGLRFFHDGQFEGRKKGVPVQLLRRAPEPTDGVLQSFYSRLLQCMQRPQLTNGEWRLLDCVPAWEGNWTWDCFICFLWRKPGCAPFLVVVNYASNQSQCYAPLPLDELRGHTVLLSDLTGSAVYERHGDELISRGLYLDLPPWGYHVFPLETL